MGILKTGLKILGSAALGTAGLATTVLRGFASAAGADEISDVIGVLQDKSFDTIRDMWTPEEKRTEEYYEESVNRSIARTESAERYGERQREKYERLKEKNSRE